QGILNSIPGCTVIVPFGNASRLAATMSSTLTPNWRLIAYSVSFGLTVYFLPVATGLFAGGTPAGAGLIKGSDRLMDGGFAPVAPGLPRRIVAGGGVIKGVALFRPTLGTSVPSTVARDSRNCCVVVAVRCADNSALRSSFSRISRARSG